MSSSSSSSSYPISFPKDKPILSLDLLPGNEAPLIYVLHFSGTETHDNRLTVDFLKQLLTALKHVEAAWDSQENQRLGAALITTGQTTSKFYSNGLDFESAISTPGFFDTYLYRVYETLLTFPIPTIASIGGHCFAAGFALAMSHDYRVMNGKRGYVCMNEIEFGAQVPPGMYAALNSKLLPHAVMRKIVLEGHRFDATEAAKERMVDVVAPPATGEQDGGAQATLDASIALAKQVGKKAAADAYQSNKLVMHAPFLAILRETNEQACAKL